MSNSEGLVFPDGLVLVGRSARRAGLEVQLTTFEARLIQAFAEAGGRVLSREDLMQALDRDVADPRSLDSAISRIRGKLKKIEAKNIFISIYGSGGWRLAPLAESEASPRAEPEARQQGEPPAPAKLEASARAELEARIRAELEARIREELEARIREELEARVREELEARIREELETDARAEVEALQQLQQKIKSQAKANSDLRRQVAELQSRLEHEASLKVDQEAKAEARGAEMARAQLIAFLDTQAGCFTRLAETMQGRVHERTVSSVSGLIADIKAHVRGMPLGGASPQDRATLAPPEVP